MQWSGTTPHPNNLPLCCLVYLFIQVGLQFHSKVMELTIWGTLLIQLLKVLRSLLPQHTPHSHMRSDLEWSTYKLSHKNIRDQSAFRADNLRTRPAQSQSLPLFLTHTHTHTHVRIFLGLKHFIDILYCTFKSLPHMMEKPSYIATTCCNTVPWPATSAWKSGTRNARATEPRRGWPWFNFRARNGKLRLPCGTECSMECFMREQRPPVSL